MPIHLIASVTGSPGVTTTAIAWTCLAAQPTLLVEADMTGGSAVLAGPFRAEVAAQHTILDLARQQPAEIAETVWWNALPLPGTEDRRVLPTISAPVQARALAPRWRVIGEALTVAADQTGTDILIDYGRLSTQNAARPLLEIADTVLVLTSTTLPAVYATARTVEALRAELTRSGSPQRLAVVPVAVRPGLPLRRAGTAARPFTTAEVAAVLTPTDTLPAVAYDPDTAAVYSAGTTAPRHSRGYTASIQALIAAAAGHAQRMRELAGREAG